MTDIQLYKEIESLPEELKKQVSDFVEFLKQKTKISSKKDKTKKITPKFGSLKGKIQMSDDFDAPLEI
ncbi:MAG: DUF2281 domain-containing protein [Bergeyella sp.]